jgi:glycosyltransferase involved in cell wall biosynthesis
MLSNDYYPNIGGVANHIYYLAREMSRLGLDVHIITSKQCNQSISLELSSSIKLHRLEINDKCKGINLINRSFSYLTKLYNLNEDNTIIHLHGMELPSYLLKMLFPNSHAVWTNHSSGFLRSFELKNRQYIYCKIYFSKMDAIISPSVEINLCSQETWPKMNCYYIPNGVDTTEFCPKSNDDRLIMRQKLGIGEDQFVIFIPRRWVEKNGIIYLIKSITLIDKELLKKAVFLFAGNQSIGAEPWYINSIQDEISKVSGFANIILLGDILHDKMVQYYSIANLVIIPSLIEAVSLAALEAMSMGIPIIATKVGGLPEIIHHEKTGLLVSPKSSQELADMITRCLTEDRLISELGRNARQFVCDNYTWQNIASKTINIYQKVMLQKR